MKAPQLLTPESPADSAGNARRTLSGVLLVFVASILSGCEGTMVTPTVTWLPAEAPVPPIVAESGTVSATGKTDAEASPSESESTDPAVTPSADE
ncbi:MAG: hypothetical protein KF777_05440 [Planctomycetaceae bacterium]|nr:hypothetical protein [Planctomycetaceae bacterium]